MTLQYCQPAPHDFSSQPQKLNALNGRNRVFREVGIINTVDGVRVNTSSSICRRLLHCHNTHIFEEKKKNVTAFFVCLEIAGAAREFLFGKQEKKDCPDKKEENNHPYISAH